MKIGIITFHYTKNFGGCLQALALQNVVQKMDPTYQVEIIDYRSKVIADIYNGFSFGKYFRTIKRGQFRTTLLMLLSDLKNFSFNIKLDNKFSNFYSSFYKRSSKHCYSFKKGHKIFNNKYDVLISGSDQIWNPILLFGIDKMYYLSFDSNGKKISYASSIGQDNLDEHYYKELKNLLQSYKHISVREESGVKNLLKIMNLPPKLVIDPTLLLTSTEWDTLFQNTVNRFPFKDYILVYTIKWSNDLVLYANELSKSKNIPIISFYGKKVFSNELAHLPNLTPDEFVVLFKEAKYVITNSYHGTIFSLQYKKKFCTFLSNERNGRIITLLESLNLANRIITSSSSISTIDNPIDYSLIDSKLFSLRNDSLDFLYNSIKN